MSADAAARARIEALAARAIRHETAGPGGGMVWHEWGHGGGEEGSHRPLLLLHGGSGSWTHWIHNIEHFATRYRVIVGDLPGLGDSPSPREPYDAASLAAIVAAGCEQLLPAGERFDLVGFSFGGIVAGHLAMQRAEWIRSVTIIGSPLFGLPSTGRSNELLAVDPALDLASAEPLHRANLSTLMFADPASVTPLALRIHHDNLRRGRLRSRKIARTDTLAVALREVTCPVHGIWGEHDVTVSPDMQALREMILSTGPAASFDVVAGAGHWVIYEAAAACNALVDRHLAAARNEETSRCPPR